MSELDKVIDQIESHAALAREQKLRAEIERLLGVCKDKAVLLTDAYAQIERLRADNETLRQMLKTLTEVDPQYGRRALEDRK